MLETASANHVMLPDGRRLAYAEYGDPDGQPLMFFHGLPGSSLSVLPAVRDPSYGLRVIAPDRPGFGGSDPQPGRRLDQWPADVACLADQLSLTKFYVAGESSGAAHALVCAWALPERVIAVASIAGGQVGARDIIGQLPTGTRVLFALSRSAPWLLRVMFAAARVQARRGPEALARSFASPANQVPIGEQRLLADPNVCSALASGFVSAFQQGSSATITEIRYVAARPWPFDPGEITTPTVVWHGADDHTIPPFLSERLVAAIPEAELNLVAGAGHHLAGSHWPEIATSLLAHAPALADPNNQ